MALGILLVSHVPAIANGVETLIKQVAKDVPCLLYTSDAADDTR